MSPGRTIAAVAVCALIMVGCAAGAFRTAWWLALGIPTAPLIAAGLLCRER